MAEAECQAGQDTARAIARHYLDPPYDYGRARDVLNVEPMLWAFGQTGDERLLDLALDTYRAFHRQDPDRECTLEYMLSDQESTIRRVTFNETACG